MKNEIIKHFSIKKLNGSIIFFFITDSKELKNEDIFFRLNLNNYNNEILYNYSYLDIEYLIKKSYDLLEDIEYDFLLLELKEL